MRFLLTAPFFALTLAATSAQKVPVCPSDPPNISVLTANAESGDPKAQLALGQTYQDAKDPEKLPQSVYWFTKAAEQGNAEAEWMLADAYGAGEGVTRDDRSALYWSRKAAEDGQAQAQWVLGMNYRDGRSVERDHQEAFKWFLRAAKQGDADSQVSVAQMYEDGDSVPQDYVQAANWYKKAAEHVSDRGGAGAARSSLGFLYIEGLGVRQDYRTAYMYFALSNSKENMQWAAEKMTSSQIDEAQRKAQEWIQQHPEPQICAAGLGSARLRLYQKTRPDIRL
jgi:TPR repeat protein